MKKTWYLILGTVWFFQLTLWAWPKFEYDPHHPFLSTDFQKEINLLTQSEVTYGNHVELLIDALSSLTKKIELAKSAQKTIFLSTMIFLTHLDPLMQEFCDILIEKAKSGVSVYFIMDEANSYVDSGIFKKLERNGIHIVYFNPLFGGSDPIPFSIRMHEKYMVVDGTQAVIGGQNMYDERYPFLPFEAMNWRDTDIYVEGPAAQQMANHFVDVWASITNQTGPQKIEITPGELELDPQKRSSHLGEARYLYNEPYTGNKWINAYYLKLIRQAQHHIIWAANQVVLTEEFEIALKEAANRGVKVLLLTNSWSTAWWQPVWYQYFFWTGYRPFFGSNVELRLYQSRFNHSKILYVDGVVTSIGSFNHDYMSLQNDAESTVVSYDRDFNEKVLKQLVMDLEDTSGPGFWAWLFQLFSRN